MKNFFMIFSSIFEITQKLSDIFNEKCKESSKIEISAVNPLKSLKSLKSVFFFNFLKF